jgi:hypothetical protein
MELRGRVLIRRPVVTRSIDWCGLRCSVAGWRLRRHGVRVGQVAAVRPSAHQAPGSPAHPSEDKDASQGNADPTQPPAGDRPGGNRRRRPHGGRRALGSAAHLPPGGWTQTRRSRRRCPPAERRRRLPAAQAVCGAAAGADAPPPVGRGGPQGGAAGRALLRGAGQQGNTFASGRRRTPRSSPWGATSAFAARPARPTASGRRRKPNPDARRFHSVHRHMNRKVSNCGAVAGPPSRVTFVRPLRRVFGCSAATAPGGRKRADFRDTQPHGRCATSHASGRIAPSGGGPPTGHREADDLGRLPGPRLAPAGRGDLRAPPGFPSPRIPLGPRLDGPRLAGAVAAEPRRTLRGRADTRPSPLWPKCGPGGSRLLGLIGLVKLFLQGFHAEDQFLEANVKVIGPRGRL